MCQYQRYSVVQAEGVQIMIEQFRPTIMGNYRQFMLEAVHVPESMG